MMSYVMLIVALAVADEDQIRRMKLAYYATAKGEIARFIESDIRAILRKRPSRPPDIDYLNNLIEFSKRRFPLVSLMCFLKT